MRRIAPAQPRTVVKPVLVEAMKGILPDAIRLRGKGGFFNEPYFRGIERSVLQELLPQRHMIVSTGGGTFVDPENRADRPIVTLSPTPNPFTAHRYAIPFTPHALPTRLADTSLHSGAMSQAPATKYTDGSGPLFVTTNE